MPEINEVAPWAEDVLGRKIYAEFLTNYLVSKFDVSPEMSFCMALDAPWGEGKSFLVSNWCKQLSSSSNFPAYIYDAWASDYNSDPVVSFMAKMREEIKLQISKSSISAAAKSSADEMIDKGMKKLRGAIMPAGKVLLKGVINKALAGTLDELVSTFSDTDTGLTTDKVGSSSELEGSLDELFDECLKGDIEREILLSEFRDNISNALSILCKSCDKKLPFFVFIDEIDRCRPNYAVSLLEGIKHIFNIPGVCFIFSTNIAQLSYAMSAVYGVGFDGRGYLQRFFDVEYSLPQVSGLAFAEQLVSECDFLRLNNIYSGIPTRGFYSPVRDDSVKVAIEWVASDFSLDFRSQRRMMEIARACMAGLSGSKTVHLIWLLILIASRIKAPDIFYHLSDRSYSDSELKRLWAENGLPDKYREYNKIARYGFSNKSDTSARASLMKIAGKYHELIGISLTKLNRDIIDDSPIGIENQIHMKFLEEIPGSWSSGAWLPASAKSYSELVKCAGYISTG